MTPLDFSGTLVLATALKFIGASLALFGVIAGVPLGTNVLMWVARAVRGVVGGLSW